METAVVTWRGGREILLMGHVAGDISCIVCLRVRSREAHVGKGFSLPNQIDVYMFLFVSDFLLFCFTW